MTEQTKITVKPNNAVISEILSIARSLTVGFLKLIVHITYVIIPAFMPRANFDVTYKLYSNSGEFIGKTKSVTVAREQVSKIVSGDNLVIVYWQNDRQRGQTVLPVDSSEQQSWIIQALQPTSSLNNR